MHRRRLPSLLAAAALLLASCGNAPPPDVVHNRGLETWHFSAELTTPASRGPASRTANGWLSRFGVPDGTLVLGGQSSVRVTPAKPWVDNASGTTAVRWFAG